MNNSMLYRDIPNGRCFRLAEAETVCSRIVHETGIFVKIGNSHAVRVQAGLEAKTIIPGLKTKCTMLPGKIDTSYLKDWFIVNQPYTKEWA